QHVCGLDGNCYAICGTTYCYGSTPVCGQDYECHAACPTGSNYYCINGSVCLADGTCSTTTSTYTSDTAAPTSTGSQAASGGSSSGGGGGSALSTGAIIGIAVVAGVVVIAVIVAAVILCRPGRVRASDKMAPMQQQYTAYAQGPPQQTSVLPPPPGPPSGGATETDYSYPPEPTGGMSVSSYPGSAGPAAAVDARQSYLSGATSVPVSGSPHNSAAVQGYGTAPGEFIVSPAGHDAGSRGSANSASETTTTGYAYAPVLPAVSAFSPPPASAYSQPPASAAAATPYPVMGGGGAPAQPPPLPKDAEAGYLFPAAANSERAPPSYKTQGLFG
ncbi:hypothetical protein HK405_016017, partial [Cladochytrium tenue]